MDRTFACPECGNELRLKGLSAGRQVRCGWCSTFVEVPFLPRSAGMTRSRGGRGRRPAWVPWAWAALAVAGVLIVVLGARHTIRARERQRVERSLAERISAAENDEDAGQLDQAVSGYDEAIQVAESADGPGSSRVEDLRKRRDTDREAIRAGAARRRLSPGRDQPPRGRRRGPGAPGPRPPRPAD